MADVGNLTNPLLLRALLLFMTDSETPDRTGYLIAFLMGVCSLFLNFLVSWQGSLAINTGTRMRTALMSLVYQKSLYAGHSPGNPNDQTMGQTVNIMSVEADRLRLLMEFFHVSWSTPLVLVLSTGLLLWELGWSAFAGIGVLCLSVWLNVLVSSSMKSHESQRSADKDERISPTSELLSIIRVVKLCSLETTLMGLIDETRERELSSVQKICYSACAPQLMANVVPVLVVASTFICYVLSDDSHILTPSNVFFTMAILNFVRLPLGLLPSFISHAAGARVAVQRMEQFLSNPDRQEYVTRDQDQDLVSIVSAECRWHGQKTGSEFCLRVPSFQSTTGQMTAVVGSVGSGKSSLLHCILGDMQLMEGRVNISPEVRKIAYVPQQAWILNQTVKQNILFGQEFQEEKYKKIMTLCELDEDMDILPAGDETEIGEKGINLSGGQKQRISIARACYSDADLFLFDDPLSAVDAHVAKNLIDNIFSPASGLLAGKTIILVTNNLTVLPFAGTVVRVKDGEVGIGAPVEKVMSEGLEFQVSSSRSEEEPEDKPVEGQESPLAPSTKDEAPAKRGFKVYLSYLRLMPLIVLLVFCFLLNQVCDAGSNYWLALWSRGSKNETTAMTQEFRVEILSLLTLLSVIFQSVAGFALARDVVLASRQLHRKLLSSVLHSPMSFFETTPVGRLLNRFSSDMDAMDSRMQSALTMFLTNGGKMIASFVIIVCVIPYFALAILPILLLLYVVHGFGLKAELQVRRLEAGLRSRIYSHFGQTVNGLTSVRAYDAERRFTSDFHVFLDANQEAIHTFVDLSRWRILHLDFVGTCAIVLIAFFTVATRGHVDPAFMGLAAVYAMQMPILLNFTIMGLTQVEAEAVALERVVEYMELEPEPEWETRPGSRPSDWPSKGEIEFESFSTRYRPGLDLAIKDMKLKIKSKEKVGVVGRTGSGKSTITLSLMRMMEGVDGRILIDGIDISTLGLQDLRRSMTIIPQDPVLFSGTIRSNLDPFNDASDDALWSALESAHLAKYVKSLESGLDHPVSEGGDKMSVGERQLLCLGRAIVRKTKILMMDEATAAVDTQTDKLIQETMRQEFTDCTVITIAHRLQTILDSDHVLVMDEGRVAEFDSPSNLLADPESMFSALARDANVTSS